MKLSARNQLKGTISAINHGSVGCLVAVQLPGGELVKSLVPLSSAKELDLKEGQDIFVFIHEYSVRLAPMDKLFHADPHSIIEAYIEEIELGATTARLRLCTSGLLSLEAITSITTLTELDLQETDGVSVFFNYHDVHLAIEMEPPVAFNSHCKGDEDAPFIMQEGGEFCYYTGKEFWVQCAAAGAVDAVFFSEKPANLRADNPISPIAQIYLLSKNPVSLSYNRWNLQTYVFHIIPDVSCLHRITVTQHQDINSTHPKERLWTINPSSGRPDPFYNCIQCMFFTRDEIPILLEELHQAAFEELLLSEFGAYPGDVALQMAQQDLEARGVKFSKIFKLSGLGDAIELVNALKCVIAYSRAFAASGCMYGDFNSAKSGVVMQLYSDKTGSTILWADSWDSEVMMAPKGSRGYFSEAPGGIYEEINHQLR